LNLPYIPHLCHIKRTVALNAASSAAEVSASITRFHAENL
jgi:hypothetical protein